MWRGALCAGVALPAALLSGCEEPPRLEPGALLERELTARPSEFSVPVAGGRLARLTVESIGDIGPPPSLEIRLRSPSGDQLAEAVVRGKSGGQFAWVSDTGGDHRLEVGLQDPLATGRFRLDLKVQVAQAGDCWRAAAENAEAEATRHREEMDLTPAVSALLQAAADWRRAGEEGREVATYLDVCALERNWRRYEDALSHCDRGLRRAEQTGRAELVSEALSHRGVALKNAGRLEEALSTYSQARAVADAAGHPAAAALAMSNTGVLYLSTGDLERAEAALDEALRLGNAAGGLGPVCYTRLARAQIAKRRLEIERAYQEVLEARSCAVAAEDRFAEAAALHELGNLAQQRGDLTSALDFYESARHLNLELGEWRKVADGERSLGGLSLPIRGSAVALSHHQRALELARALEDAEAIAEALREIGTVHEADGSLERADEFYREALAAAPDDSAETRARILYRLGTLALARGDLDRATDSLQEALLLRRGSKDPRGLSLTHRDLGVVLTEVGRLAEAREHLLTALALDRRQRDPMLEAVTLYRIAQLEEASGNLDAARARLEEAIELGRDLRAQLSTDRFRVGFYSGVRPLFEFRVELLMRLAGSRPNGGYEALAFQATEEARARGLLDLLREGAEELRGGIDPELQHQASLVEHRLTYLSNRRLEELTRNPDSPLIALLEAQYDAADQEWERLDRRFRELSQSYRRAQEPVTLRLSDAQDLLQPGQALLVFWIAPRASYLFVVTESRFDVHRLPPAEQISERALRFRDALLKRLPPSRVAGDGIWLYRTLIAPALEQIRDHEQLIIVPDGVLHLLPFSALPTEELPSGTGEPSYLLRSRSISYAPSVTVLAALRSQVLSRGHSEGPRLVVFADPLYSRPPALFCPSADGKDDVELPSAPALEASRLEGEALVALYGASESRAYFGAEATEEQVRRSKELSGAEHIHFAVHAAICEQRPERSALILALDEDPAEDGLLQVREILGLQLSADLVTLSACDTGLGKQITGEGVVGLSRAFLHAGARSVTVSLWQIEDQSSAQLMAEFYRNLEGSDGHGDRAEALRQAQLTVLGQGGRRAHPLYWAPFVLIGSRAG